MGRGQIEGRGLPGQARPIVIVGTALQGEGRRVGVQAYAAVVVGRSAADGRERRGGSKGAAVGRPGHGNRRRCLIQGEAGGAAREAIACDVGRGRPHRVSAVGLGRPVGQSGAARPHCHGVSGGRAVAGGQIDDACLPGRAGPIKVVGTPLQAEGRAVGR